MRASERPQRRFDRNRCCTLCVRDTKLSPGRVRWQTAVAAPRVTIFIFGVGMSRTQKHVRDRRRSGCSTSPHYPIHVPLQPQQWREL